jgi:hypothetical protein
MESSGHKKTPVRNRGFVPSRSEVVQPLRSRDTNIQKSPHISLVMSSDLGVFRADQSTINRREVSLRRLRISEEEVV